MEPASTLAGLPNGVRGAGSRSTLGTLRFNPDRVAKCRRSHVSIPSAKSEERIFVAFLLVSPSERPDVAKLVEISDVHDRKRESPHFSAQASELALLEPPI